MISAHGRLEQRGVVERAVETEDPAILCCHVFMERGLYRKTAVFRITRALEHFCREEVQMLRSTPLRSEDYIVKHKYFASPERWGTFAGKGSRCLDLPPLGARIVW